LNVLTVTAGADQPKGHRLTIGLNYQGLRG